MLEEPPKAAAAPKAPPMPCPDKPIRFLEVPPVVPKPTVKKPPAGAKVPPRFDDQGQVVEQKPVGPPAAARAPPVPKQEVSSGALAASSSSGGATADTPEMVGGATDPSDDYLRRQAFIRQEQMARSQAGLILLPDATYQDAIESSIARELAEQRHAEAAALARAKPKNHRRIWSGLRSASLSAPSLVVSSWRRRSRRPLPHRRPLRGLRWRSPPRPQRRLPRLQRLRRRLPRRL